MITRLIKHAAMLHTAQRQQLTGAFLFLLRSLTLSTSFSPSQHRKQEEGNKKHPNFLISTEKRKEVETYIFTGSSTKGSAANTRLPGEPENHTTPPRCCWSALLLSASALQPCIFHGLQILLYIIYVFCNVVCVFECVHNLQMLMIEYILVCVHVCTQLLMCRLKFWWDWPLPWRSADTFTDLPSSCLMICCLEITP